MTTHPVLIIGSGPAGLTAAVYTARAELQPLVIAGVEAGGQLMLTTDVENYPGFPTIKGPELMAKMIEHAEKFGATILRKNATKIDVSSRPFRVWVGDDEYSAESIIVATGASAKWLGLESETKLRGHGVSSCATCDGFFFKGKEVAVIGGGDTALEDATFLTKFATKVTIIHRRAELRASKPLIRRAQTNPKISFLWNKEVTTVLGADAVEGILLHDVQSGETSELAIQGLFVAIGHTPNTAIFKDHLALDEHGYIVADGTKTNVEGVFVAGDVEDIRYRQAVTAAGSGCRAALDAERWLSEQEATA